MSRSTRIPDFSELRRSLRRPKDDVQLVRVALLGDSSTQLLGEAIRGYGVHEGLAIELFEADYDQVEKQILDPSSELYAFRPECVVIFRGTRKAIDRFRRFPACRLRFAETYLDETRQLWASISRRLQSRIIQFNWAEPEDGVFGNFSNKVESSLTYQIRKANLGLMDLARESSNAFVLDLSALQNRFGRDCVEDRRIAVNADMLFSLDVLPHVAKGVVDILQAAQGRIHKCLILDLDNTLWGGVIGDDGIENIHLGALGIGLAFTEFQLWIKQLAERGIILSVCSKNTEALAKEPFEKHPDMVLRLADIAVFMANWESKVDNIRAIQKVLNIGYDSMVFLDDSPFERNLVREHLPGLTVPELPEDPVDFLPFLQAANLFETISYSSEDQDRIKRYQVEARRVEASAHSTSVDSYLEGLEMLAHVEPFTVFNRPRIAQLINRSNQFNLRTVRYSEDEIDIIMASRRHRTLSFSLADRFGDYGLISLLILEDTPAGLFIDTWIMSCRVLKRGVEDFVMTKLVRSAQEWEYDTLVGEYITTAKNGIVKDLYEKLGFTRDPQSGHWLLKGGDFSPQKCFVREQ